MRVKTKRSWLSRRLPYLYGAFIVIGFLLIDWVGYDLLLPDPAPYRYELVTEGTIANFPDLILSAPSKLAIRKFEARLDHDGTPFADVYVADLGAEFAPVLLDWQERSTDLSIVVPSRSADLNDLAQAVKLHVPDDGVLLGWWDTSRQLHALTGVQIVYDVNLPRPLFIPSDWEDDFSAIESLEKIFWRISEKGGPDFERFLDALSTQKEEGLATLKAIAGRQKHFIVVQLSDAYKLSLARPDLVRVGYRDFVASKDIHDDIIQVKKWLDAQGVADYAVESLGWAKKRVYYLRDRASAGTLIAQMLPFGNFKPTLLDGLKLVGNYGSYWVYEMDFQTQ